MPASQTYFKRLIHPAIFAAIIAVGGCAANLATPSGQHLRGAMYNKAIDQQGLHHYCADGACDAPPKLITGTVPTYPRDALVNGRRGDATVAFSINTNGVTGNIEVISSTSPEFADAAVHAVESWKFQPAELDGKPVQIRVSQSFPFHF